MKRTKTIWNLVAGTLLLAAGFAIADEVTPAQNQDQSRIQNRQAVGREMMGDEEREEHRSQMRNAKSKEERERIRVEKHEEMKERASERGVSIPDEPREQGKGQGSRGQGGYGGSQRGR